MNLDSFRRYCLTKKGVTEEFPFNETTLVFKVMGKMFALTDTVEFTGINLKVDPEIGADLRERYPFVQPAFHMNKLHWITVLLEQGVTERQVREWVDNSYILVVKGLTKSQRLRLDRL